MERDKEKENGELVVCPICKVSIYERNLERHKRIIH